MPYMSHMVSPKRTISKRTTFVLLGRVKGNADLLVTDRLRFGAPMSMRAFQGRTLAGNLAKGVSTLCPKVVIPVLLFQSVTVHHYSINFAFCPSAGLILSSSSTQYWDSYLILLKNPFFFLLLSNGSRLSGAEKSPVRNRLINLYSILRPRRHAN